MYIRSNATKHKKMKEIKKKEESWYEEPLHDSDKTAPAHYYLL